MLLALRLEISNSNVLLDADLTCKIGKRFETFASSNYALSFRGRGSLCSRYRSLPRPDAHDTAAEARHTGKRRTRHHLFPATRGAHLELLLRF